jgi:hypothetical protein
MIVPVEPMEVQIEAALSFQVMGNPFPLCEVAIFIGSLVHASLADTRATNGGRLDVTAR